MDVCNEFAIFTVAKDNVQRAIELSQAIFSEMNQAQKVIIDFQILQKTDNPQEICWHLTWINSQTAKETTQKWPTFASTKAFQGLVEKDLYYGHFVNALVKTPN